MKAGSNMHVYTITGEQGPSYLEVPLDAQAPSIALRHSPLGTETHSSSLVCVSTVYVHST
jgi:hypothetical protein